MASKKLRVTKSHLICFVLSQSRDPMTRVDVMHRVFSMQPHDMPFLPTSNNCYWAPRLGHNVYGASRSSVIVKGLVKKGGHIGRKLTYSLTPAGHAHALEYIASKA